MTSPFKFLDAYDRQDKEIFFGRSEEIAQLYQLIFQTHLLLVYGQSGTGKTSLIQCGLANRFKSGDWFEVFVRRKDDINASLDRELRRHAKTKIKDTASVAKAVGSLYLDHLRPIYLIFDQFEELFVLGTKEEQDRFIQTIGTLLQANLACTIIIVMREEYIAMLYDFERAVPALFNKRFRVEPMGRRNVEDVIVQTCRQVGIGLENGDETARRIIDSLSDRRAGVQLSYLQVYLDKLFRTATRSRAAVLDGSVPDAPLVFTEDLIRRTGALGDVMADFLEEQTFSIQTAMKGRFGTLPDDAVQRILETLATLEGTKAPMTRTELGARLPAFSGFLDACLTAFEASRLVRHADGVYELAHDSLAARIAERRSADRKSLLRLQKVIKDGYAGFLQTQTFLSKEELAFVHPYVTKLDSLDLTGDETAFVAKSIARVRAAQRKVIVATAAVVLLLSSGLAYATFYRWKAEQTIADASAVVGFVSRAEAALEAFAGSGDVRRELRETATDLNTRLGLDDAEQPGRRFWRQLSEGDALFAAARNVAPGGANVPGGESYAGAQARFETARDIAAGELKSKRNDRAWRRNLSIAYLTLGDLHSSLSDIDTARAAYGSAFELRRALAQDFAGDEQSQRDLFESLYALGDLEKSVGDAQPGDPRTRTAYDTARQRYASALTIAEGFTDVNRPERQRDRVLIHRKLGELERSASKFADAQTHLEQARDLVEPMTRQNPGDVQAKRELFDIYSAFGALHSSSSNQRAAADAYAKSLAVAQTLAEPHEWLMAGSYRNLGALEAAEGDQLRTANDPGAAASYDRARGWYAMVVDVARRQADADPASIDRQRQLASAFVDSGDFELYNAWRNVAAIDWYKKALAIAEPLTKREPRNVRTHMELWTILDRMGTAFDGLGTAVAGADANEPQARAWFVKGLSAARVVAEQNLHEGRTILRTYVERAKAAKSAGLANVRLWHEHALALATHLAGAHAGDAQTRIDLTAAREAMAGLER